MKLKKKSLYKNDSKSYLFIKPPKFFHKTKKKKSSQKTFLKNNISIKTVSIIIILILYFIIFNYSEKRSNIFINNTNSTLNNKGFLKIKTAHKSKFTYYDYKSNIIVYKDLYDNITYKSINEKNAIIPSKQISRDKYFELCEKKTLLDNTKYKRNPNPKISVVIPYYNKKKFSLYICLRSVQNQSFKDIEIIFVDDGSDEQNIKEILEEMKNDNRIILLKHKENKGTLMTRVDGVRYASGEYIIQLDQDDLYIDNLLFEKLYKKAKEQDIDIVQFSTLIYETVDKVTQLEILTPKNTLIKQPELRITFLQKLDEKRFSYCSTRMIWDKFVKRKTYLEAIDDLGDEYLNHKFFLYEDTLMMFELSQVALSYYFYYELEGYRLNKYMQGQSRDNVPNALENTAMNQLYFVKLLLYKVDPKYDRYHIYKEWGFSTCGSEATAINKNDIDLVYEVVEAIFELEKLYNNTVPELIDCAKTIKEYFQNKYPNNIL